MIAALSSMSVVAVFAICIGLSQARSDCDAVVVEPFTLFPYTMEKTGTNHHANTLNQMKLTVPECAWLCLQLQNCSGFEYRRIDGRCHVKVSNIAGSYPVRITNPKWEYYHRVLDTSELDLDGCEGIYIPGFGDATKIPDSDPTDPNNEKVYDSLSDKDRFKKISYALIGAAGILFLLYLVVRIRRAVSNYRLRRNFGDKMRAKPKENYSTGAKTLLLLDTDSHEENHETTPYEIDDREDDRYQDNYGGGGYDSDADDEGSVWGVPTRPLYRHTVEYSTAEETDVGDTIFRKV
eukprot:m.25057 g.25057  ORF g.25057 m.25057 type:complete len:293 (-) comp7670_c0_seq1:32-910(-)